MKVKVKELGALTIKALFNQGDTTSEAKIISDILMYAQLRGNNQGVVKLIGNGIPKREGNKTPKIVQETAVSTLYDGRKTHAMVVMATMTNIDGVLEVECFVPGGKPEWISLVPARA